MSESIASSTSSASSSDKVSVCKDFTITMVSKLLGNSRLCIQSKKSKHGVERFVICVGPEPRGVHFMLFRKKSSYSMVMCLSLANGASASCTSEGHHLLSGKIFVL